MPAPPSSSGTVMPSRPSAPSFCQRSAGKALSASMAAARGAISTAAKRRTHVAERHDLLVEAKAHHGVEHRFLLAAARRDVSQFPGGASSGLVGPDDFGAGPVQSSGTAGAFRAISFTCADRVVGRCSGRTA